MKQVVSMVIPTRNSEKTLGMCIESVIHQSYPNNEIIIVDSGSTDSTLEIAKKMKCKVIRSSWKLLGARYEGLRASRGHYVLILDSDQILERETTETCLKLMDVHDMLCLEETTDNAKTMIQKLFEADRRLINNNPSIQKHPVQGTLLARFYKRELLEEAFRAIPDSLLTFVIAHDHAIIYYEAWKLSKKVGIVPKAIRHNEPASLKELWAKNFRYGRSTKKLFQAGYYNDFLREKTFHLRCSRSAISKDKLLSTLLLLLKAPAYLSGRYF